MTQVKGTEERFVEDKLAQQAITSLSDAAWNLTSLLPPWISWAFKIPPMSWFLNWLRKRHTEAVAKLAGNKVGGIRIKFDKAEDRVAYDAKVEEIRVVQAKPEISEEERIQQLEELNATLGKLVSPRRF
jgi:hypothetical protein